VSDIDDQSEEVRGKHGRTSSASISSLDPRVSRGLSIFMGCLGVVAVAVGAWVGTSINQLNVSVGRLAERIEAKESRDVTQDTRISRAEDRIENLNRDVATLEGRNLRGGPNAH
jgi:ubiquinone biosynthesis protein UbiJ